MHLRTNFSDLKHVSTSISSLFLTEGVIRTWYFSHIVNVGDLVGPYLIEKITGKRIVPSIFGLREHIISVGSIFSQANDNSYIWGSGLISKDESIYISNSAKIAMVRGQLTKKELESRGLDMSAVALLDPASLLPKFYSPKINKKYKVGVVPHYVDYEKFNKQHIDKDVVIIDVKQSVEAFVDKLLECELVISSSLHGLIISDSYGIPNVWVATHNKLSGDDFKYYDYFSNFEIDAPRKMNLEEDLSNVDVLILEKSLRTCDDFALSSALRAFPI